MPKIIYSDPDSGQDVTVELSEELPEITIGRNPGNIVRVNNPSISRRHAKLVLDAGEVTLYDLDSSNGSYVNGNRIKSQVLIDGDRVRIGEFPVDYVDPTDSATAEVSPEMIESVLEPEESGSQHPHRQTRLGGFEAEEVSSPAQPAPQFDSGPHQFGDQPSAGTPFPSGDAPQQPPQPPEQPSNAFGQPRPGYEEDAPTYDHSQQSDWGDPGSGPFEQPVSNPYELPPSDPTNDFSAHAGGSPEQGSGAFGQPQQGFGQQQGSIGEHGFDDYVDEDAETGIGDAGYAFRQGSFASGASSEEFVVDDADIEELVDDHMLAGASEAESQGDDDVVTYNAPPEEIALGLRAFDRMGSAEDQQIADGTVEDDITRSASLYGPGDVSPPSAETEELLTRIAELENERDELLDILQNRASDVGGAASTQLERLRTERDRLIEEGRSTKRQLQDAHQRLAAAPGPEELATLREELADTLASRDELQEELEALRIQFQQQSEGESGLVQQLEESNEELRRVREELESKESEREQLEEARQALDDQLQSVQSELTDARAGASEAQKTIENLEEQLQELRSNSSATQGDLAEKVAAISSLEDRLAETEEMLDDSSVRLEDLRGVLEAEQAEKASLEGRLEEVEAELQARPASEDVAEIHDELESVRTELESVVSQRDELQEIRGELETELASTRQLLEDIQARYDSVGAQFDSIVAERDTLKKEKGAFARETDYLQTERRQLVDEVEDLRKKVKAAEKDTKKKKKIFGDLSTDLRKLVGENEKLEEELDQLRAAMVDAPRAEDLATLEARVEELEQALARREETIEELEEDSSDLTRELGKIADERDELATKLEAANEEIAQLQETAEASGEAVDRVEELRTEKEELEERAAAAEAKVAELEDELNQLQESGESASSELEEKTGIIEELEARVEELEGQIEEVDPELAEKVGELQSKLSEAEETLAEIILDRDRLEDELRKAKG